MADPIRSKKIPSGGVGMPDYSQAKPTGTVATGQVYSVQDVGELAVRLQSPVKYDRRGYVVMMDDFRNGKHGWLETVLLSTISWVADYNNGSGFACKFRGGSGTCSISRHLFRPFTGHRVGAELNYRLIDRGATRPGDWLAMNLTVADPTTSRNFYARVNMQTNKVQIQSGGLGVWVDVAEANNAYQMVHHLKVVGNWHTGNFERVMFDGEEHDISDYPGFDGAGAYNYLGLNVINFSGVAYEHLIQSVIGTVSEPENETP